MVISIGFIAFLLCGSGGVVAVHATIKASAEKRPTAG
jgi:hypothetical protein